MKSGKSMALGFAAALSRIIAAEQAASASIAYARQGTPMLPRQSPPGTRAKRQAKHRRWAGKAAR